MTADAIRHVKLQRAPLKRAICQLRFPTVLGFSASVVRPFQQAVEDEYPSVRVDRVIVGVGSSGVDSPPPQVDLKDVYRFSVIEGDTVVAIADDFLSLETSNYDRFAHFSARWERVVRLACETLGLRYQARLGLRYTNIVENHAPEVVEGWAGLIRDHLLLPVKAISAPIEATALAEQHVIRAMTAHGGIVFRHGFPSPPEDHLPAGYLIDIDNYDDTPKRIDIPGHLAQLASWDHQSYALLRSSVTDALWGSFGPEEAL